MPLGPDYSEVEDMKLPSEGSELLEVPKPLVSALKLMLATFQRKSADYSESDASWDSNFVTTSEHFGLTRFEVCDFFELTKLARLRALRKRGTQPQNEPLVDTYLDKANYALYALALLLESSA